MHYIHIFILKTIFYFIELCVVFEYLKNILQHLAIVYTSSFEKHIKNYKQFFTEFLSFYLALSPFLFLSISLPCVGSDLVLDLV